LLWRCKKEGGLTQNAITKPGSWNESHLYHWEWNSSEDQAEVFVDGVSKYLHTTNIPVVNLEVCFVEAQTTGHDAMVDWVFVRKCIGVEPTHSVWEAEESNISGNGGNGEQSLYNITLIGPYQWILVHILASNRFCRILEHLIW